ncbi:hypothetical protein JF66_03970 [Cryobacterium sp. MLB-32]|nr:hypothetical protein JF66_03970 [Cryobacterium sp. MLB-32]
MWSDSAVRYLGDQRICPRCDIALVDEQWCANCGAELSGPVAAELADASARAAVALEVREMVIGRIITRWPHQATAERTGRTLGTEQPDTPRRSPGSPETGARPGTTSQISVQSVLAVAGAGLLAVAALVFTFLNSDLTSFATRTMTIAAITAAFVVGAWFFARNRLQFSAESVGALAVVFVGLDIWALTHVAPAGRGSLFLAGIGTLFGALLLLRLGASARIRVWVWSAVVGLAFTPVLFGAAGSSALSPVLGTVAVAAVMLLLQAVVRRLEPRFESGLSAEYTTATGFQIVAVLAALLQVVLLPLPDGAPRIIVSAGVLTALALVAARASRNGFPRAWSAAVGALIVTTIGILPLALDLVDSAWYLALIPAASGAALVSLSMVRPALTARRPDLLRGAAVVAALAVVPATVVAVQQYLFPFASLALAVLGRAVSPVASLVPPTLGLASILATGVAAATLWVLSSRTHGGEAPGGVGGRVTALWATLLTLLTVTGWAGFERPTQAVVGLTLASVLSLALVRMPALAVAPRALRAPLIAGAHLSLALSAAIGWTQAGTALWVGAVAVAVLAAVARTRPVRWRPLYLGVGYAYALIVFSSALNLAQFENIIVLCLTTTLASLYALAATLTTWLSPRSWYATLIVTTVPFLLGILAVLMVRSGWTALSTGVTFALALTLLLTRRTGMSSALRSAAAALLVPSLAVVVVCLGAQLPMSGSPIVLPIIALIVAGIFPLTHRMALGLRHRGIPEREADSARRWIEISALITSGLAVVLALVRIAAGLPTALLVLLVLGFGAAATALSTHRRFAWWAAGISWTGALWCLWALLGVSMIEAFLLPPAVAVAITGAILVARGRPGVGLYAVGLTFAIVPTLLVLVLSGAHYYVTAPWSATALLVGSLALLLLGRWVMGHPLSMRYSGLRILRRPTLVLATVAAGAGAAQAVRWGLGLDLLDLAIQPLVMLPVLALSIVAALLATATAYLLRAADDAPDTSRWRYAAATAFLVVGPITAIRHDVLSVTTLMTLTVGLLGFMLVVVTRARTRRVSLPPAWFLFALAWGTAVAGWSERELRVEAFSLPLGLGLLAAGILAMRPPRESPPTTGFWSGLAAWPNGFTGSWRLLAPGIVVTFLPSVLATGTDPQTWRAMLVMTLALAAILIGSLLRLAAPFMVGLSVLPIEIAVVFSVQIGRTINPLLWWITLAAVGAVLLVIAITSERNTADQSSIRAGLRDLG